MTGTHHGAIDFDWLVSNIEVGELSYGTDEERVGKAETFVLGPKAIYAAESYILGLFQLYPTVYLHKTTRGSGKLFSEILLRAIELIRNGSVADTGLPARHPIVLFAQNPDTVENLLALDDTVVWGALSMMAEAGDATIAGFSKRLRDRHLFKCFDVRDRLIRQLGASATPKAIATASAAIREKMNQWKHDHRGGSPRILVDQANREPYKRFQESKGPLNQIMVRTGAANLMDIGGLSKVIAAIEPFDLFRLYADREDRSAGDFIEATIVEEARRQNA